MKNLRKIAALLLAFAFVATCALCFTACGDPGDDPNGGGGSNSGEKVYYVIGATGPLEGANSQYGVAVYNGAMLAINEINRELALTNVAFKLDMKHDACGAEEAANAYSVLVDSMHVSLGSVTSGAAKSFADCAKEDNVLCLTPSASADPVINSGNHSFRVCFGDPQQGEIAAEELVGAGYTKIGVVYDNSDAYSKGLYDAFVAKMTSLEKVQDTDYVVKTFDATTKTTFHTQAVTDLKNAGCDAIFLPIYYDEAYLVAKEAATKAFNVPILGCDGLDGIASKLDSTITAEIRYITPFDVNSTDEKTAAFVAAYKAAYNNEVPNQFAADAYDAVMIIYEAMKYAANNGQTITTDISASDLCNILKAVLTGGTFKYSGLTGSDMTWTAGGSCNKAAQIVKVNG